MRGPGEAAEGVWRPDLEGRLHQPTTECELKAMTCEHIHTQEGLVSVGWRTDGMDRGARSQKRGDR